MLRRSGGLPCLIGVVLVCILPMACRFAHHPSAPDTYVGPPKAPENPEEAAAKVLANQSVKETPKPAVPAPPAKEPTPAKAPEAATGPIKLDVHEAVLMAMEHNQALAVERFAPVIARTFVGQQWGDFDPILSATVSNELTSTLRQPREMWLSDRAQALLDLANGVNVDAAGRRFRNTNSQLAPVIANAILAQFATSQFFPTGTTVALSLTTQTNDQSFYQPLAQTRLGLSVEQPLLRGAGTEVNLARLRQARIDVLASQYQLRGFAEVLDGQVERSYWEYVLALQVEKIHADGLVFAEKQAKDVEERIKAGVVGESERASAESEVDLRKQDLIAAQVAVAKARIHLVRLLNPQGADVWTCTIEIQDAAAVPEDAFEDVGGYVRISQNMRPDLNQARLLVQREELEIVRTKNGLLPKLDLFFTVGKSGYGESIGGSWTHLDENGYDLLFGLSASYPAGNHTAEAQYQRAKATRQQALEAVSNLAQLVEEDVRTAYVEVEGARRQVAASQATRKAMERTLAAEIEKYNVGRSTYLLIGRAQRDVIAAQVAEAKALADYRKAIVDLYRTEGTLLERRGILAPGREPAEIAKPRKGR